MTEPVSESPVSPPEAPPEACLDSWKEIAAYFNRDKRTVQRWERNEGMPVHRHQHDKHGTVYALKAELDEWWKGRRARIERQEEAEKHSILRWPAPVDAIRTPLPVSVDARYETLAEIGSGGMGIVFKARDRETGEVVALKVLRTELAKDEAWMDRFKDELRLARKVTHRNVCRIHEFVRTEDCAYISMEFVDGESLRQILNRFGALSARTAVGISEQICAGLAEAHEEGVIHRDLKPENIMLDRHGQIKVMDFGVAARLGIHEQNPGQILGTPAYMAPEQTEGRTPDKRTDVYAVGLILYEMVTGRPAFVGNTPLEVALKQVREMPAKPSSFERGIPERVESAIIKSLQKSPQARFQTAREQAEALKDEFEARPVLAPSETIELLRHVEGPRWRKWDWVLLALGLASAAAFLLLNQRVWPFTTFRLEMAREQALGLAQGMVRAYAPELRHGTYFVRFDAGLQMMGLPDYAEQHGAKRALEAAREVPRSWSISLVQSGKTEDAFATSSSQFDFDVHGDLLALRLVRGETLPGVRNSNPEREAVGAGFLQGLFDVPPQGAMRRKLVPGSDGNSWIRETGERLQSPGPSLTPEEWGWKDPKGDTREARFWVAGSHLRSAEKLLPGHGLPLVAKAISGGHLAAVGNVLLVSLSIAMIVVYVVKHLYRLRSRTCVVLAMITALSLAGFTWIAPDQDFPPLNGQAIQSTPVAPPLEPTDLLAFLVLGACVYVAAAAPFHVATSIFPEKITTLDLVFGGELGSRYVGLALTRGAIYGAICLGANLFLLLALGRGEPGDLQMISGQLLSGSATIGGVGALVIMLGNSTYAVLLSAMVYALAWRLWKRRWLALLITAALMGFCTVSLSERVTAPLLAEVLWMLLESLIMSSVLAWNDLLTCWMALVTYATFTVAVPVHQIFGKTSPGVASLGLVFWAIMFLYGVCVFGWSLLRPGLGRIGGFLEVSAR